MKVEVGKTVEPLGDSGWKKQVVQVHLGGEFPEKAEIMIGPDDESMKPGAYTLDLGRALQKRTVIVDGKRPGTKQTRDMIVLEIRPEYLVVSASPPLRSAG